MVVGRHIGVGFERSVGNRDLQEITHLFQVVELELLHLVRRIATFEVLAETVTLDRVSENHGGLTLVLCGGLEGRVDLLVVVSASLESPNLVVCISFDKFERTRVARKEVFANESPVFGLVRLEITVGGDVHEGAQRPLFVAREQVIPFATPNDLDDVPASASEEAFEFLDNLAVATNGTIKSLQVAVDDEVEVVESFVGRDLKLTATFDLIHLAVAEECPNLLVGGVLDTAVRQVAVELCLVDRIDRSEPHRHGWELPELGHEAGVWI
ncbi:unannotated protein [freshwater metagenome]|uniref:Unannotated protein n=1 Tax=freshwater metagenome TaxID=449393 RepID=A0A6J6DS64_9ZZZZ